MATVVSLVGDTKVVNEIDLRITNGISEKDSPQESLQAGPLNCPAGTQEVIWAAPTILRMAIEFGPPMLAFLTALIPLLRELRKKDPEKEQVVINLSVKDSYDIAVTDESNPDEIMLAIGAG